MNTLLKDNKTRPSTLFRISIFDYTVDDLRIWLKENGYPAYSAQQIFQWIYQKRILSFEQMTNLSKNLRAELEESFSTELPEVKTKQYDEADGAEKILLTLPDGEGVECVAMPSFSDKVKTSHKTGKIRDLNKKKFQDYTLCLSTQVGCMFACRFCASGKMGLKRNLTTGEIITQVITFLTEGKTVSRIVFMGTGEPLHNLLNLRKSIDILTTKEGMGLSSRRITVSTVGLVPEIYRIALEGWKVKLAVSLHATRDQQRAELMPLAKIYQLDQLMDALRFYQQNQSRRISFEYLLLEGINDRKQDATRLGDLFKGIESHVNLIPFNRIEKTSYITPSENQAQAFRKMLLQKGIDTTIRYSRGRNIDAACGQLRLRYE